MHLWLFVSEFWLFISKLWEIMSEFWVYIFHIFEFTFFNLAKKVTIARYKFAITFFIFILWQKKKQNCTILKKKLDLWGRISEIRESRQFRLFSQNYKKKNVRIVIFKLKFAWCNLRIVRKKECWNYIS